MAVGTAEQEDLVESVILQGPVTVGHACSSLPSEATSWAGPALLDLGRPVPSQLSQELETSVPTGQIPGPGVFRSGKGRKNPAGLSYLNTHFTSLPLPPL